MSWRKFLATDAGKTGLLFLREGYPSIQKGPEHEMVFDAGRNRGYSEALDKMMDLITIQQDKDLNLENK